MALVAVRNIIVLACSYRVRISDAQAALEYSTFKRDLIRVACVGDSITQGYRGSALPPAEAYPTVLQRLLGEGYNVTNLGKTGKTVQKIRKAGHASGSYWQSEEFEMLTAETWDIVVLQLGSNDAKDEGNEGPPNWKHELCDSPENDASCPFWEDFSALIAHIRTLGSPDIFINVPPPIMKPGPYGINQTVVNTILPRMIPKIAGANSITLDHVLNMFDALGGNSIAQVPTSGCTADMSTVSGCRYFCDTNFCDNCHPSDDGFQAMASVVANAITQVSHPQVHCGSSRCSPPGRTPQFL